MNGDVRSRKNLWRRIPSWRLISRRRLKDEGITSVECNHTRVAGLSSADLEDVIELTTAMLSHIDSLLSEEKAKVLGIVRGMSIDEVLAYRKKGPVLPDMSRIEERRKK